MVSYIKTESNIGDTVVEKKLCLQKKDKRPYRQCSLLSYATLKGV